MNVQELINLLETVEDKTLDVGTLSFVGDCGEYNKIETVVGLGHTSKNKRIYLDLEEV